MQSPSFFSLFLIYGVGIAVALTYQISISWHRNITISIYIIPAIWLLFNFFDNFKKKNLKIELIDILIFFFIFIVVINMFINAKTNTLSYDIKNFSLLILLVIVPYMLGRIVSYEDVIFFKNGIFFLALFISPFLVINFFNGGGLYGRWPVFGKDAGGILIGGLFASVLPIICINMINQWDFFLKKRFFYQFLWCIAIVFFCVILVLIMSRGWLLASLLGSFAACFGMHSGSIKLRMGLLILMTVSISITILMHPLASNFYSKIFENKNSTDFKVSFVDNPTPLKPPFVDNPTPLKPPKDSEIIPDCPILGVDTCKVMSDSVDSVEIRRLLYLESALLFFKKPIWGVGAGQYGKCSCSGQGSHPHSTILQVFVELGLIGGCLFIAILLFQVLSLVRLLIVEKCVNCQSSFCIMLALFLLFLFADQIYGNYFTMPGTSFLLGAGVSLCAPANRFVKNK